MSFNRAELEERARLANLNSTELEQIISALGDSSIHDQLSTFLDVTDTYVVSQDPEQTRTVNGKDEIIRIFGTPGQKSAELFGKPFTELGRNSADHFRMFLISKGMTGQDLLTIGRGHLNEESKQKVHDLRKEFMSLILDPDEERRINNVVTMYDRFLDRVPNILNESIKAANEGRIVDAIQLGRSVGNMQSYAFQTFDLGIVGRYPNVPLNEIPELCAGTVSFLQKLTEKRAGKTGYTLNNVSYPFCAITMTADVLKHGIDAFKETGIFGNTYFDFLASGIDQVKKTSTLLGNADPAARPGLADAKFAENVLNNVYSPLPDNQKNAILKDLEKPSFGTLLDDLRNNHRYNIFGKQKNNSPEYDRVIEALSTVMQDDVFENPSEEDYRNLREKCQAYLDNRTPRSSVGQERFILIQRVMNIATAHEQWVQKYDRVAEAPQVEAAQPEVDQNGGQEVNAQNGIARENAPVQEERVHRLSFNDLKPGDVDLDKKSGRKTVEPLAKSDEMKLDQPKKERSSMNK